MTALFRWSTTTMGPFFPRLVLFTGTVPALSSRAGYDTMPAFIVPAMAQPVGFRPRAHGFALVSFGNLMRSGVQVSFAPARS